MKTSQIIFAYVALFAIISFVAYATDPNQLQDFCVGVNHPLDGFFVNGLFCKDPNRVLPDDFLFSGLKPASLNKLGFGVTLVSAMNLAGLNTLGISLARLDFGPFGLNPPHTHPRATEVFTVLEGTFLVGFVTSDLANNGGNNLIAKVLNKGDVFVFPQGLIHFQFNIANYPAYGISGLSSQNPGLITIANAVFGPNPPISVDVLAKAFNLDPNTVKYLQAQFGMPGGY